MPEQIGVPAQFDNHMTGIVSNGKEPIRISAYVYVLALVAAGAGLSRQNIGESYSYTTLRGQTTEIYGQGLYRYDTRFMGAGYKGQDVILLALGIPLLIVSIFLSRRKSSQGHLLLTGVLGYFLYVYASMALGAAYNRLFLVYVALFSLSLFSFILVFSKLYQSDIYAHASKKRGLALFMLASGLVTLFVWGTALIQNKLPPRLDSYTTHVTYALDLAIITPTAFLSGILILRGKHSGYIVAIPLLTIIILLAPQIVLSTVFQRFAGVPFTTGEMVGPIAGFVLLGLIAMWLFLSLLRSVNG